MEDLKLVKASDQYKEQVQMMLEEVRSVDEDVPWQYAGMASLEKYENFEDWLEKIEKETKPEELLPRRVPASTYFLVRKDDDKLLGMFNIRHELNDYLLNYSGHIGYSIVPSERRKGYGWQGLKLALEIAHSLGIYKVLVTCNIKNEASAKVIEKCDGKLENIITCPKGNVIKRYWIDN
ncbi:MAG: GNAT family N-acetyltransferase [Bacilli bacterium]|nr:GNAT family N-acetyltransferase [Bacilli bacterium]